MPLRRRSPARLSDLRAMRGAVAEGGPEMPSAEGALETLRGVRDSAAGAEADSMFPVREEAHALDEAAPGEAEGVGPLPVLPGDAGG